MISVVCVYNNENVFNNVLLKSLKNQSASYEFIALDNRSSRFKSAAEALNYGGKKATGDYIMFVHQDMWLGSDKWIEDAEKILKTLPDLGVAGVAGVIDSHDKMEKYKFSIMVYDETFKRMSPVTKPEKVETLDECVLIVPKNVFETLKFDEINFDGWDCYGSDYCLSIMESGLKSYVLPLTCSHCCLRRQNNLWDFKGLLKYQKKLYRKYKNQHKKIYTWMGTISWSYLKLLGIYQLIGSVYDRCFPSFSYYLKKELSDCHSVLNLGCGYFSPLSKCEIEYSIGVDNDMSILEESQRYCIHSYHICGDIKEIEFKDNSFDAVVMLDLLKYVSNDELHALISKMERWAKQKIILRIPNLSQYPKQHEVDKNLKIGENNITWSIKNFKKMGYKAHGIDGCLLLKKRNHFIYNIFNQLIQNIFFYFPSMAHSLLLIKNKVTR